jgi:putative transposase
LLYAIRLAKDKFPFKPYALCIMSNHVHYLLEPANPQNLPHIMHWLNWYTAMCFNRMLNRTGHFWEQRYFCSGFPTQDHQRALNTLRYIHANPKAAGIRSGFTYGYSNYGTYASLADDGLTVWHPAYLALGETLDQCAARYRGFCRVYQGKHKPGERRSPWGGLWLPDASRKLTTRTPAPGQAAFWQPPGVAKQIQCQVTNLQEGLTPALKTAFEVAKRFAQANTLVF